jgi:hypothetical protein
MALALEQLLAIGCLAKLGFVTFGLQGHEDLLVPGDPHMLQEEPPPN